MPNVDLNGVDLLVAAQRDPLARPAFRSGAATPTVNSTVVGALPIAVPRLPRRYRNSDGTGTRPARISRSAVAFRVPPTIRRRQPPGPPAPDADHRRTPRHSDRDTPPAPEEVATDLTARRPHANVPPAAGRVPSRPTRAHGTRPAAPTPAHAGSVPSARWTRVGTLNAGGMIEPAPAPGGPAPGCPIAQPGTPGPARPGDARDRHRVAGRHAPSGPDTWRAVS